MSKTTINTDFVQRALKQITENDHGIRHLDKLQEWITQCSDTEATSINLYRLSESWGVDIRELTALFLWATKFGLFDLHWNIRCPMCNGKTENHDSLGHMHSGSHCVMCKSDFVCELDNTIEVTFSISGNVRPLPENVAEEKCGPADQRLNGFQIINSPIFRKYFSDELLSEQENLSVRHVAIMFTDLKGSTQMYQQLGDARAFKIVRQHFDVLEQAIHAHGGVIVKTIGDAVMASFAKTSEAVGAAIDAQKQFRTFNESMQLQDGVTIRIGIHVGNSLMVTLNNRLDYFGTMVNIAARVEALGDGNEILITRNVFDDLGVKNELLSRAQSIQPFTARLKGIRDEQKVMKVVYN
ncbi:MAG TPA: adenylate/guanylate cyclase domain-containing protein [bacterium]|nr:adenylate/guanylate cyclase domain-containing protein [bacterium]HNI09908.1 adenylate/guanylate cyclase domain-containing protein [bacterium]HNL26870.1 adenylate/guanylate cyclase domain-containing protein [bacterium]HNO92375.1 adenylate/guanylate cyclase domain-containing protein [bacterium]